MVSMTKTVGISILSPPSFGGSGNNQIPGILQMIQQVWNVLYKNIPYNIKQRDAVFAVISLFFCMSRYL